jgi:hypothetical protein
MARFQKEEPAEFPDSDMSDYMPLPLVVANDKVRQQGLSVASELVLANDEAVRQQGFSVASELVVANDEAVRQQGLSVASEAPRRRKSRVERSSTYLEALAAYIHSIQEQNDNLKKQLAYQLKVDNTRRAFFEEVRSASERLQSAVQKFRLDEKEIDQEFIQESSF